MMFVRHTLKIANYALTGLGVLFALITLYMWGQAFLVWGDSYAFAEALSFTVITLVVFALGAGVDYLQNRGA